MKTSDFNKQLTSSQLKENIAKQFGVNVNLTKYNREQLEDMRNKLRTRVFQQEGSAGINDLLTNETYQKDKAMLELLNTRIKEMLGEDIKKLKDKMIELSEGKKGVKVAKHPKGSKGSNMASQDHDGDGRIETDKEEVWGSRARAAAKAGKPFQEAVKDKVCPKCGEKQHTGKCAVEEEVYTGASEWKQTSMSLAAAKKKFGDANAKIEGKNRLGEPIVVVRTGDVKEGFDDMMKAVADRNKGTEQGKKSVSKTGHEVDRSKPGVVKATKVAPKEKDVKEAAKKAKEPFAVGMAAAKKEAGIKKTPAKDLPKAVVKKGHEIGKSIKKSQKDESAAIYRRHVKIVNESLQYLLSEDEEEKAEAITAAGDMANDFTSWMQRVGQYQTKVMIELSDEIRHNFGAQQAEAFKQAVSPALAATLETLTAQREVISNAISVLAGGQVPPAEPMGAPTTPEPEAGMEPAAPDTLNPPAGDEFAASEPAATGREMRESKFSRRLAESHSIISKLAR